MDSFHYDSLLDLIEEYPQDLEDIQTQYIELLSFLTEVQPLSKEIFVSQVQEISTMGKIIVAYFQDPITGKIVLVGTGTIIIEPKIIHKGKYVGHIEDVVIHNSYRSHGIASELLQKLQDYGVQKDCYKIILDCKEKLISFYEKNLVRRHCNIIYKSSISKYYTPLFII
jgi:glucosamine-phosphate N-acetyltransferase